MKISVGELGWVRIPPEIAQRESSAREDSNSQLDYLFQKSYLNNDLPWKLVALKSALEHVDSSEIRIVLDAMAGCGLTGVVMACVLKPSLLVLNDIDKDCHRVLEYNFGRTFRGIPVRTYNKDIRDFRGKQRELVYFDFNKFTINSLSDWEQALRRQAVFAEYLLFTDSAQYGFKFPKNLESYGVSSPTEYYEKLSQALHNRVGLRISAVSMAPKVAIVVAHKAHEDGIKFLHNRDKLPLEIVGGLGLL